MIPGFDGLRAGVAQGSKPESGVDWFNILVSTGVPVLARKRNHCKVIRRLRQDVSSTECKNQVERNRLHNDALLSSRISFFPADVSQGHG